MRLRAITALLTAALALGIGSVPVAAQEEEPPPEPPLTVSVESVLVPATVGKLVSRGVRVTASCNLDCVIVVKVRLPAGVAARLGSKTTIGFTAIDAVKDQVVTTWATIRPGPAKKLRTYTGSKGLKVDVRALP